MVVVKPGAIQTDIWSKGHASSSAVLGKVAEGALAPYERVVKQVGRAVS